MSKTVNIRGYEIELFGEVESFTAASERQRQYLHFLLTRLMVDEEMFPTPIADLHSEAAAYYIEELKRIEGELESTGEELDRTAEMGSSDFSTAPRLQDRADAPAERRAGCLSAGLFALVILGVAAAFR